MIFLFHLVRIIWSAWSSFLFCREGNSLWEPAISPQSIGQRAEDTGFEPVPSLPRSSPLPPPGQGRFPQGTGERAHSRARPRVPSQGCCPGLPEGCRSITGPAGGGGIPAREPQLASPRAARRRWPHLQRCARSLRRLDAGPGYQEAHRTPGRGARNSGRSAARRLAGSQPAPQQRLRDRPAGRIRNGQERGSKNAGKTAVWRLYFRKPGRN